MSESQSVFDLQNQQVTGDQTNVAGDYVHTEYTGPAYARPNYRGDISGIINLYGDAFVGRTTEIARIEELARSRQASYLLVEAGPGMGKSALIAQLIHRLEQERWANPPDILYYFIRQEGGRNTPVTYYQNINAQLLNLLKGRGGVPQDLDLLRNQFTALWSQAVAQASAERPLLLLVDGLDEQADGPASIAAELPRELRDYVHVVVTSRPNPRPLEAISPEHPFKAADRLALQRLTVDEVAALLHFYGLDQLDAADLAPRVWAVARKGEPLFARFVCQDVAADRAALERLETHPPADVEAYFRRQFHDLDHSAEGDLTWDILGLLTVTLGGITINEIAEALDVPRRRVRKALMPILRFILGDDRLELMHLELRRGVQAEFDNEERTTYRTRLLEWCLRYQSQGWPPETPGYIFDHLAQHLAAAGRYDDLRALFVDDRWLRVRVAHNNFIYTGYLADLTAAWEYSFRAAPSGSTYMLTALADSVHYALIHTAINSLSASYIPELIVRALETGHPDWTLDRALDIASNIVTTEPKSQLLIAILHSEVDLSVQSLRVTTVALEAALAIGDQWSRAETLTALAPQLEGEPLTRALEAALAIGDERSRAETLSDLAPHLEGEERSRALTRALEAALTIGDEWFRAQALAIGDEWSRAQPLAAILSRSISSPSTTSGVRKTLNAHLWRTYRQRDRADLLEFIAIDKLFAPPIVDQPTIACIAQSIIDICWNWRWL